MDYRDFIKKYPDEKDCKRIFKECREKVGIICHNCGNTSHYWKKDKEQYECKKCKTRTTLRSGTIMHKSKLPYRYWFITMCLLTSVKKHFSAKEIQRQLNHSRYAPIWQMVQKLRAIMGKKNEEYILAGNIEMTEHFFVKETSEAKKKENPEQSHNSNNSKKALLLMEIPQVEIFKPEKKTFEKGFLKVKIIDNLSKDGINKEIKNLSLTSDKLSKMKDNHYINLKDFIASYDNENMSKIKIRKNMPWVHIRISNTKRQLINSYHKIKPEFVQAYVDEFSYKFNQRYLTDLLFAKLLISVVSYKNELMYRYG